MGLKCWNENHAKCVPLKRKNSKAKPETLCFNNMKNLEVTSEELVDTQVLDNFTVENVTQNLKEHSLDLKLDYMRTLIAIEQGEGERSRMC